MSLLAELKRRQVYRVAVAYAVVGWLLIEIATQVFPVFHIPDWAAQLVVLLIAIGFPVAMVLAWAFELTPEGVRRTEPETSAAARAPEHQRLVGRKLDFVIIAVLVVAVAGLAWRVFAPHGTSGNAKDRGAPATVSTPVPQAHNDSDATLGKSIAVLPFENLSADKNNAYFADGMQDLIMTRLAGIGDLKVISRNSTAQFKSHPDDLASIARRLGVATILEGSVQKAGKQVLINVQLIDAQTDSHIWAHDYTRELDNVFDVEGEVAQKVADALKAKLTTPEKQQLAAIPTRNPAAYDAYLHARAVSARNPRDTAASYHKAVELDPDFGLAWAGLAGAEAILYSDHLGDREQSRAAARQALDKAQSLAPNAAETQLALSGYRFRVLNDLKGGRVACNQALAISPGNQDAIGCVIRANAISGQWQSALDLARKSVSLDPLNPDKLLQAAGTFEATRDFSTALKLVDRALVLRPGDVAAIELKADIYQNQGRLQAAGELLTGLDASRSGMPELFLIHARWQQKFLARDYAAAAAEWRPVLKPHSSLSLGWRVSGGSELGMALYKAGQAQAAHDAWVQTRAAAHQLLSRQDKADRNSRAFYYGNLSWAEAGLGHHQAALAAAREAVNQVPTSRNALDAPFFEINAAWIEAWVGNHDVAIAALPHLLRLRGSPLVTLPLLKLDPMWDPLRDDPRFQALLEKYAADKPATVSASPATRASPHPDAAGT